jgi:OCT family organic cation transporter-like MFS transporter 4/5
MFASGLAWLLTVFTMIGKMGITASFSGIYVFTAELFPTPIRHLAVGSSSMMSRISGLLAPFMGEPMVSWLHSAFTALKGTWFS